MNRVLVTGGAGTIGAAVVRRLSSDPDFEIRVSDQREAPDWMREGCEVHTGDLRESIFYGFPPSGTDHVWESFSAFNATAPKIEWRIEVDGAREVPVATIHRWSVSNDPEDSDKKTEVLVIEKVVSVNTTAAGGNAALMSLEGE